MKVHNLIVLILLLCNGYIIAQEPVQNILGVLRSSSNGLPIANAVIQLEGQSKSTTSDSTGGFEFTGLSLGRYELKVSHISYQSAVVENIFLLAGEDYNGIIYLDSKAFDLSEAVVTGQSSIYRNADVLPSAIFTIEETSRIPANFFDPARMASILPGVSADNDQANNLVIRGSSPAWLKWRLEGLEVINPNHLTNAGTLSDRASISGGGTNILSAQMLGSTNIYKNQWPARYGNALSGIIDLEFKKVSPTQRPDVLLKAGLLGLEGASEGQLGQNQKWTYSFNSRYSFTGLLGDLGVDFGGETIRYADIALNLERQVGETGTLKLFGIYGRSTNDFNRISDSSLISEQKELYDIKYQNETGVLGIRYSFRTGRKIRSNLGIAYSFQNWERDQSIFSGYSNFIQNGVKTSFDKQDAKKVSISISNSQRLFKEEKESKLEYGIELMYDDVDLASSLVTGSFKDSIAGNLRGWQISPFLQTRVQLDHKWAINGIFRYNFSTLEHTGVLSPRILIIRDLGSSRKLSLEAGIYSMLKPAALQISNSTNEANTNKGYLKNNKLALVYAQKIRKIKSNIAVTGYLEFLKNLGVETAVSSFNSNNLLEIFRYNGTELESSGSVRNVGLEILLRRKMYQGYYYWLTGSIYESSYLGSDEIERKSRYNGAYMSRLILGREWSLERSNNKKFIGLSTSFRIRGGWRISPVDVRESLDMGYTIYEEQNAWAEQNPLYFRIDLSVYLIGNKGNRQSKWSLDIQNLLNREHIYGRVYDFYTNEVVKTTQLGLIPNLTYQLSLF